jgi:hypothetical protein
MEKSLDTLYEDHSMKITYLPESSEIHLVSFGYGTPLEKKVLLQEGILKKFATCSLDELRDKLCDSEMGKISVALEKYNISIEHFGAAASRAYMKACKEFGKRDRNGKMYHFLDYFVIKHPFEEINTNEERYQLLENFVKELSKSL